MLSLAVAVDLAALAQPGELIVSFSADHGRDYLPREYNADWLRANGLADVPDRYLDQPTERKPRP